MENNVVGVCLDCIEERKRKIQECFPDVLNKIKKSEEAFIKTGFVDKDKVEHMWVKVKKVNEEARVFEGYLDNDPVMVTNFKSGDKVSILFTEVEEVITL